MTVHFIGAGPGADDLITVRGLNLLKRCPVVLYAGSLIPESLVSQAGHDARVVDTAPLHLDQIIELIKEAHDAGHDVARLQSGDPSIYGAIAEQIRRLEVLGIPCDVTPGVPSFSAAAAALGKELTLPELSQTIVLTRTAVRATGMPDGEELERFADGSATLAIHLSINNLARIVRVLERFRGPDCPIAVAYRIGWPDQKIIRGTACDIRAKVKAAGITRTALILVGAVLDANIVHESRLYDRDHHHVLRPLAARN